MAKFKIIEGSIRNKPRHEYHKGAIVELTDDEAKEYSHQIEAITVDTDKEITDIADNKAIKKNTVTKK